jgi:hypothetical protein
MARFIPYDGEMYEGRDVLDIGVLQTFVGGLVRFIDIGFGDNVVCHEDAEIIYPENVTASSLYHQQFFGPVVVCNMKELL